MERATLEKLALKKCSAQNYDRLKECIDSMTDIMLFAIVRNKLITYEFGEDPVTCGECGARTKFEELPGNTKLHQCLNCKDQFLATEHKVFH